MRERSERKCRGNQRGRARTRDAQSLRTKGSVRSMTGTLPYAVGMVECGKEYVTDTSKSIPCAKSAGREESLLRLRRYTTFFRWLKVERMIGTTSCHFASRVTLKSLRGMVTDGQGVENYNFYSNYRVDFDPVGGVESLRQPPRSTGAPLHAKIRKSF